MTVHNLKHRSLHTAPAAFARRGFMAMELAMTLPILLIVLLALLEFSLLFFARGAVVEASRLAARKATLPGVTIEDIEAEARKALSPRLQARMTVHVELADRSGEMVTAGVRVPMLDAAPDLLWPIGYSLRNQNLYGETRMVRE